ncbi:MAG: peptide ABC transporter substrate-binding protein [Candidatus Latescibacteria bacterium]|nr:peptide ABC transporter substrate-binding protein [Candidatus Latescibacterota bacterium]
MRASLALHACILVWTSALCGMTLVLADHGQPSGSRYINSIGVPLPSDAAPPSEQVVRSFQVDNTYMEWFRTIYKGTYGLRKIAEPLIRLDKNFNLLPAGAERWEASPDGRTWYFYIRRGLEFSDGRPLTAHDWVFTFRRGADPKNAYDVEWYYRPIKNWGAVVAGKKPLDALGVRTIDDYTLAIDTETVCAYLPDLLIDSWVSPRHAIQKYGDAWSTKPETSIASGPFYLAEWSKGNQIVLKANPKYHGPAKPYIEVLIAKLYTLSARPPVLAAYEADEVDYADILSQAERGRILSDPVLRTELHSFTDFATYYLTMNTYVGVFTNKKVRQAFSHAIDRDALTRSALQGFAIPAYSMLPPGFPAAASDRLRTFQRYDPALARQCLTEAGYPGGRGFPPVELWVRADSRPVNDAGEAVQAMLKQNLGIDVTVRVMEVKTFMDAINSHRLQLGLVRFGFDFVDPSSLMNLWLSSGRHAWRHDLFDRLVVQAGAVVGDPARRMALYHQAERILVEDVGGVFLWHSTLNQMWKSKIRGDALEANQFGYRAWRGDQVGDTSTTIYITKPSSVVGKR